MRFLAGFNLKSAIYLGRNLVFTVREWYPDKKVYPAVFPEEDCAACFDPLKDGPTLVEEIDCDGILIDTFHKDIGKGLLDYYDLDQLTAFVKDLHRIGKEAWFAGSITKDELTGLWKTGVDVICVRGAACEPRDNCARFGNITAACVHTLVATL